MSEDGKMMLLSFAIATGVGILIFGALGFAFMGLTWVLGV